jgi:hypothetical protein
MKHPLFAVLLALALLAACSRKQAQSPPAPIQTADQPASPPADNSTAAPTASDAPVQMPDGSQTGAVISAPENGDMSRTLADLTMAVRTYIVSTHRQPTSFEDFVASSRTPVPSAPPGKKYVLDRRFHVILADQ